jgi:hypothetical protein
VAFDVPTVALGSTDALQPHEPASAVVRTGVSAALPPQGCPIDHRCMTRMSAEMVLAACERVLAGV